MKTISTHTLTWSVTQAFHNELFALQFQLTRSRGAWHLKLSKVRTMVNFNSHAHVERDRSSNARPDRTENFNSHAHVERDGIRLWGTTRCSYFNSHAHVERDSWAALYNLHTFRISTHTLTWSVTARVKPAPFNALNFNSHAHVERDEQYEEITGQKYEFQLTRSRGAWHWRCKQLPPAIEFQLTRSRGAWLGEIVRNWINAQFQLTRSRGAWHTVLLNILLI